MIKSTPRKTGRPIAVYTDRHGNKIPGLMRLADRRWRANGPEKFTFSEPDEDLAISRYHSLLQRRAEPKLATIQFFSDPADAAKEAARRAKVTGEAIIDFPLDAAFAVADIGQAPTASTHVIDHNLSPQQWGWLRGQIQDRPKWVAKMVGIEQIGYLADIPNLHDALNFPVVNGEFQRAVNNPGSAGGFYRYHNPKHSSA